MKQSYFLFIAFLFLFQISIFSQTEDPSCLAPSKKVQRMIDAGKNAADNKTAVENFGNASKEAPESAAVFFEFGIYAFKSASKMYDSNPAAAEKMMQKSKELLSKAYELCNDYHSDMLYYLGVITYSQTNKDESMQWFEKFLAFKNDDNTRYGADMTKQTKDVKEVMKELKEEKEILSTEVPFNPMLVQNVSGSDDEYFPMISPDNALMFFTRKQNTGSLGDKTYMQEVYTYSTFDEAIKKFDKGTAFKAPFNNGTFDSYGAATMSVDNKEMIICACKRTTVFNQPYMNCDLYSTTFQKIGETANDYEWSELVNLGPKINTANGWEGQPSISADGMTMYYTANGPNTKDNDVFVVTRNPKDNTWGAPRPFTEINTDGKDKSPFLHQDSETMYFVSSVSDKRKGVGGTDIFYMRQNADGSWTEPKNIGYPINSKDDELGLFVSIEGNLAYFSTKKDGNWNIYGFELYEDARPKKVAIIKGDLNDKEGNPIENATIEVAYENSDKVETVKVNGNDGKFAVIVKQETPSDVIVSVKKDGAAFESKLITKEEFKTKETKIETPLAVKEMKVGEAYTLNDILYDYNSDVLSNKSKFILKEFARYLKNNEAVKIAIQGHTDSDGEDAKNLDLSDRRAKGVLAYLTSLGIEEERLTAKGFGETTPKVENSTAENKAKNRRTDFVITGM